jgi:hypothetical protein
MNQLIPVALTIGALTFSCTLNKNDVDAESIEPEIIARGIRNTVGFDWHAGDVKDPGFGDAGGNSII